MNNRNFLTEQSKLVVKTPRTDEWKQHASCKDAPDKEIFFPEQYRTKPEQMMVAKLAKRFCLACPVVDPCLEYGFSEKLGIYGGQTAAQRKKILTARRAYRAYREG